MAQSPTTQQSTICQYCSRSYQDPRILSCLHSYCLRCISKIHIQSMTSITCPTCNHPTKLPDGGVASLPCNIHLKQEAEQDKAIQRVTTSPPPECESCEEEGSVSVAYCTDCDHLLCKTCWTSHKKMKALQSHTTFALDDLEGKNQSNFLKILTPSNSTNPLCLDHDDQRLMCYCVQCFVPVCVCCTLEKHKGHPVEEVKKQATFSKEEILQDLTLFQKGKEELEQATRSIQETMKRLENYKNECTEVQNPRYMLSCCPAWLECMFGTNTEHSSVPRDSQKILLDQNTYFWCTLLESFH